MCDTWPIYQLNAEKSHNEMKKTGRNVPSFVKSRQKGSICFLIQKQCKSNRFHQYISTIHCLSTGRDNAPYYFSNEKPWYEEITLFKQYHMGMHQLWQLFTFQSFRINKHGQQHNKLWQIKLTCQEPSDSADIFVSVKSPVHFKSWPLGCPAENINLTNYHKRSNLSSLFKSCQSYFCGKEWEV